MVILWMTCPCRVMVLTCERCFRPRPRHAEVAFALVYCLLKFKTNNDVLIRRSMTYFYYVGKFNNLPNFNDFNRYTKCINNIFSHVKTKKYYFFFFWYALLCWIMRSVHKLLFLFYYQFPFNMNSFHPY